MTVKITALTELVDTPADGDKIPIVDVSDTTDHATGTSKYVTLANLLASVRKCLTSNISNPPTHAELVSAIGEPTTDIIGNIYFINDNNAGANVYLIVCDGLGYWFTPLSDPETGSTDIPEPDFPDNAGWCWFSDPRAVYYNGKTYIGFLTNAGTNMVVEYDHATDTVGDAATVRTLMGVDDHSNLSLLIRDSDKRLMAFYTAHNGAGVYFKISTNPEDASAWGAETNLDSILSSNQYTYTMPVQLTGETNDPIYLFYRYLTIADGKPYWCYTKSTDGGANWSAAHGVYRNPGNWAYMKLTPNGDDRIDFVISDGHPRADGFASVYHFYYSGSSWHKTDGTATSTSIEPGWTTTTDFTQIYDGTITPGWIEDIEIDGSGNPVVLYTVYNSSTDRDYYRGAWNGSAWVNKKICDAGSAIDTTGSDPNAVNDYVGGASLDPVDVNIVYASVEVSGKWEIIKYVTADGGDTWTDTALTTGSALKNIRPFVPKNRQSDLKVLWLYGTYVSYTNFQLEMKGSDT